MAIGDAVAFKIAAAGGSHQPASGVEEVITSMLKSGGTDAILLDDGSLQMSCMLAASIGDTETSTTRNTKIVITNGVFLTKQATTDSIFVSGVQTNV